SKRDWISDVCSSDLDSHFFCFSLSSLYTNQSISPTIIFLKVCNNCLSPPSIVFSYALLGLAFLLFLFACRELFFLGLAFFFFFFLFFLTPMASRYFSTASSASPSKRTWPFSNQIPRVHTCSTKFILCVTIITAFARSIMS